MSQANQTGQTNEAEQGRPVIINPNDFSCEITRTGLFMKLLTGRAGSMVKVNLLVLLFALPAVAVYFLFSLASGGIGVFVPYSAHFGVGYTGSAVTDAAETGVALRFVNHLKMFGYFSAGIILLCAGLAGAFYVMRTLARGEIIPVVKNFFIGIKKYGIPFLLVSPVLAVFVFLTGVGISGYQAIGLPAPLKVFLLIVILLAFLALLTMSIFFFTLTVTYQMPFATRLKNSLVFAGKYSPRSLLILAVSALPFIGFVFLMGIPAIGYFIALFLAMLFFFTFVVLLWTVYAHWVFNREFEVAAKVVKEAEPKAAAITGGQIPAKKFASPAQKQKFGAKESAPKEKPQEEEKQPGDAQKGEKPAQHNPSGQKKGAAFKFKTKK